jgi:hypothetical protein
MRGVLEAGSPRNPRVWKFKGEKMVKLNSVGCWVDLKTGNTFPQDKNGEIVTKGFVAVHLDNCCAEWFDSLSDKDRKILNLKTINRAFLKGV